MKEERMMILNMLESGKVSAEEAARLLEVIGKSKEKEECCSSKFSQDVEEKVQQLGATVDTWAKELAEKMDGVIREVEPKLKKVTQIIVEKTAATIDEIAQTMREEKVSEEQQNEEPAKEDNQQENN
jgi:DNA mismatch repair ATPase MutS